MGKRDGNVFLYPESLKVGDIVKFSYNGGTENGFRTVTVAKNDQYSVEGKTKERNGEYRRYLLENVTSSFTVIGDEMDNAGLVKRVRFDEACTALLASLTGEKLAELYLNNVAVLGEHAEYDSGTGEVVVFLPAPTSKFTVNNNAGQPLTITNKDGKVFKLYLHNQQDVGLVNEVTGLDNTKINPEQLRDELVKFLA